MLFKCEINFANTHKFAHYNTLQLCNRHLFWIFLVLSLTITNLMLGNFLYFHNWVWKNIMIKTIILHKRTPVFSFPEIFLQQTIVVYMRYWLCTLSWGYMYRKHLILSNQCTLYNMRSSVFEKCVITCYAYICTLPKYSTEKL